MFMNQLQNSDDRPRLRCSSADPAVANAPSGESDASVSAKLLKIRGLQLQPGLAVLLKPVEADCCLRKLDALAITKSSTAATNNALGERDAGLYQRDRVWLRDCRARLLELEALPCRR